MTVAPPTDNAPTIVSARAEDFPVPTGREEQWRFTPLERLRGLHADAVADRELDVVFDAPDQVRAEVLPAHDLHVAGVWIPTDRVAARAAEGATTVNLVEIPAHLHVTDPITVALTGSGGLSFGRTLIRIGGQASAVVVLDHRGQGVHAGNVEISVGHGARLTLVSVQDWDDTAVHVGHHHAEVGREAEFVSVVVTLGGDVVRLAPTVTYAGPGGNAELHGVYFADAGQHLEHRLFVDHAVPHCRSRVTYKGALQGTGAHTVWIGDVLIRAAATGTDTYELNRNLVLTEGARADSVPNLEIETGQITGAGHASATGRFDDEQLFYLQSRGIDPETARRLVVLGFFGEVLDRIPVDSLRERLLLAVETELGYADQPDGSSS